MRTFELLAQQRLVVILALFPVPTIEIHVSQYKCTQEASQQFPTRVGVAHIRYTLPNIYTLSLRPVALILMCIYQAGVDTRGALDPFQNILAC